MNESDYYKTPIGIAHGRYLTAVNTWNGLRLDGADRSSIKSARLTAMQLKKEFYKLVRQSLKENAQPQQSGLEVIN